MIDGPDIEGYKDAQVRLRQGIGRDITFYTPTGDTWPPGAAIDPQTQRPYDPTIEPTASGFASAAVRCNVAFRPVQGLDDPTENTPVGAIETGNIVLMTDIAASGTIGAATHFDAKGDNYLIRNMQQDGIGEEDFRLLVWGERKGDAWR